MGRKKKSHQQLEVGSIEYVYRPGFEKEWGDVVTKVLHDYLIEEMRKQGVDWP